MTMFRRILYLSFSIYTVFFLAFNVLGHDSIPLILDAPNLPSFNDQQFGVGSIQIETFGREGCPYCELLKENLYTHIDFSDSIVARYYNVSHPAIKTYFNGWEQKFSLPKNLEGAVPATLINGTYLILGYNENSTSIYLDLIEQIREGKIIKEDPEHYLFVIQKEAKPASPLFFRVDSSSNHFGWISPPILIPSLLCLIGLSFYSYHSKKTNTKNSDSII